MLLATKLILLSIFLLIMIGNSKAQSINSPKLANGEIVDSFKRFPHHVTIETEDVNWNGENGRQRRLCGGSIVAVQWILTSGLCIDGSDRLHLHFEKLYYHSFNGSFTIVVNKDQIHRDPTLYYDIAMIRIPVQLKFSDTLKPVRMSSRKVNELEGLMAVMPGFNIQTTPDLTTTTTTTTFSPGGNTSTSIDSTTPNTSTNNIRSTTEEDSTFEISTTTPYTSRGNTTEDDEWSTTETESVYWTTEETTQNSYRYKRDLERNVYSSDQSHHQQLTYGMFRILSNRICKKIDNDQFDEFLQICAEDWVSSSKSNSCWDYGNGLLVGWPARTELVGIHSVLLNNCSSSTPAVYTNIAEYLPWIRSIIESDIEP